MYKTRFAKWGWRKNLKKAEKEAISQCMDAHENLGVDLGQPMLNGRPVRIPLIDRQRKEKRKADCLACKGAYLGREASGNTYQATKPNKFANEKAVDEHSAGTKRARTRRQASTILVSFSRIPDPTEYRNTEELLVQLEYYLDAKLDRDPHTSFNAWRKASTLTGDTIHIPYTFEDKAFTCIFTDGVDLFDRIHASAHFWNNGQVRSAWKFANEGAAMVRSCLQQQSPELLQHLLRFVTRDYISKYSQICDVLLRQFLAIATIILGQSHPITRVCSLLQFFPNSQDIAILAMQKTLHTFERRLGGDHQASLNILVTLCRASMDQKNYDEAKSTMRQLLNACRRLLGRNDYGARRTFFHLAELFCELGRDDAAEDALIYLAERGLKSGHLDLINILANSLRGRLCAHRGNHDAAESFCWTALSGSLLAHGSQDPFTAQALGNYQRTLREQQQSTGSLDAQTEDSDGLSADLEPPFRCFSRPRSWSFPLEKPALRIAWKNVAGVRSNRSRRRRDIVS
jgi:hypothetical protein